MRSKQGNGWRQTRGHEPDASRQGNHGVRAGRRAEGINRAALSKGVYGIWMEKDVGGVEKEAITASFDVSKAI